MAPDAWPDMNSALEEVADCLLPGRICRMAVSSEGVVIGWIGGREAGYEGNVWELHPLVVHPDHQGQGIGRALVRDLEDKVRQRGALTLQLGSDDETGMTSLSGVDLYDDLWERIHTIQNIRNHPYSFYQKLGYTIIGVMPDANGPGKPDIYMAKRL
ncbi:MAG: GNAT family N-acetyltransferase [Anaerolineae bacterium]|nr:GNAT family N-acetyltransferase [Anaerolineae bacterium]